MGNRVEQEISHCAEINRKTLAGERSCYLSMLSILSLAWIGFYGLALY